MYGVVLLMAVTVGSESADLGKKGGGCCGGGGRSARHGGRGGCHGGGGCYGGGCYGSYGGGCYGGYGYGGGGCMGGYGYGGGCTGGYGGGGMGGHGGHGRMAYAGTGGAMLASDNPNTATVVVSLPAEATLTVDGAATTSTSSVRTFETPALEPGKVYAYTLEARFARDGKPVTVTRKVRIEAGKTSTVDLTPTATGVARN